MPFRSACTKFFILPEKKNIVAKKVEYTAKKADEKGAMKCPRCGNVLTPSRTKSNQSCYVCSSCGGLSAKLSTLKTQFDESSIALIKEEAKKQVAKGCLCPNCGHQMSLIRLASSAEAVEVDVCGNCQMVWYDKAEYETLVPDDGVISATVSSGKAFRREIVVQVSADLRNSRLKVNSQKALENVLKSKYRASVDDCKSIIQILKNQGVIK